MPLIGYGAERAPIYRAYRRCWLGLLSLMMVSTLRFSSFKTVGTGSRQHQD